MCTYCQKIHNENSTAVSLSRNHDPVTQDPQIVVSKFQVRTIFFLYRHADGSVHVLMNKRLMLMAVRDENLDMSCCAELNVS